MNGIAMKTLERSPSASNSAVRVLNLLTPSNHSRANSQPDEPSSSTTSASPGSLGTRRARWSLRRKRSKGDKKPEDTDISAAPSPTAPIELVADTEPIELPGSEPGLEPDSSTDFPIWAECNEVAKVVPGIERNLARLQFLQQKSVDDPDTRPNTSINSERYALSCKTILLCRQSIIRLKEVARSPASAGFKSTMIENSRNLLRSVEHFKNAEDFYAKKLRGQMIAHYKTIIPTASEAEAQGVFDISAGQLGFTAFRQSADARVRAAAQTIGDRYTTIKEVQERITELTEFLQDIGQLLASVLQRPQPNQLGDESKINIYESKIDPEGDIILDFASGDMNYSRLQYQVSSHMLSKTSPLFAMALKISPSRTNPYIPKGMEGQLPVIPPVRVPAKSATMIFMPQKEHSISALGIVLCAAHMRNDKVPRSISFRELVEVSRVCQQYQCIDPVSLFVELLWLPQWQEWIGHPGYGDFLLISYVFGHARIFETASKRIILQLRGDPDVMEDKMLPPHVRERLRQIRAAILARILDCCRKTMRQYLPSPPLTSESNRQDGADWSANNKRWSVGTSLESKLHCPKTNRQCDANNLGWLMLIFNELGILESVTDPCLNLAQGSWFSGSLGGLVAKLCAVPGAAKVHDGDCDYAPAFRSKICEVFNSIKGLDLSEVNENYPERKRSSGVFGEMPRTTDTLSRRSSYATPDEEEGPEPAMAGDCDGHEGAAERYEPVYSASEDRLPALSQNSPGRSNEDLSSEVTFQASEADTHSIASTEITLPTERPNSPSPSISTLETIQSGIVSPIRPRQASIPLADHETLSHPAQVDPRGVNSERDRSQGTQEDEKIFWAHRAAKEIVKVEDKELIISHKHTIRIGEERGLPPIRDPPT
ncbi:hypothetical protein FGG08_000502 [Glutinoglossum americanum]|uniref:Uncharacterized protein n=1 Tax=Glutinoglossum americanum TaxID=1670608 RepID=A0A9P8IF64_9PEZI|nr:hypothetical protein FGG08_000502 [Glutinoglossum americanum]